MDMEAVYREYAEMVFGFLMTMCREETMAEELTQETFYQAIRSSNKYDGTCKISTWLCQIAKHLWYQELDKRKRKGTLPLEEDVCGSTEGMEQDICMREEKMEVFKRVHLLDEISKEVVLLRLTGSFSFREIGDIFGKNENWARVSFYRAKQKLMKGRKNYEEM
nr:sigma-70 family RNA polymerase sigma factor [uncultured Sellimonas sp.]